MNKQIEKLPIHDGTKKSNVIEVIHTRESIVGDSPIVLLLVTYVCGAVTRELFGYLPAQEYAIYALVNIIALIGIGKWKGLL